MRWEVIIPALLVVFVLLWLFMPWYWAIFATVVLAAIAILVFIVLLSRST